MLSVWGLGDVGMVVTAALWVGWFVMFAFCDLVSPCTFGCII